MLLAVGMNLMEHVNDEPWPGWEVEVFGVRVVLMSGAIASMILLAILLCVGLPLLSRRTQLMPRGRQNLMEALVVFVRDMIARPALEDKAYGFLPLLLTMFVFILGMNLMGVVPILAVTKLLGLPPIGGTATAVPMVCAALAGITLMTIVSLGFRRQAAALRAQRGWPTALCWLASPVRWLRSLSPPLPGKLGVALVVPLALLELLGAVAKCFSLLVRLCANMLAGHILLAILLLFVAQALAGALAGGGWHVTYVAPLVVLGSVAVNLLELLVAGLQAYIFTFLTALFLAMYVESSH